MGYPYLWNSQDVGIYSGVTDVVSAIVAIVFTVSVARIKRAVESKSNDKVLEISVDVKSNYIDSEKKKTSIVNLLLTILICSIFMILVNRFLLGISHMFVSSTANILVYVATVPRMAKGLTSPILRTLISMWTDHAKQDT
ncbi:unnamed protein product [Trichobilharzia szidati]|nr:unnamed protein product [Trichobilharzia szidati]